MKKIFSTNLQLMITMVVLLGSEIATAQVQQAWVARDNGVENKDEFGGLIGRDAAGFIYVAGARYTDDNNTSGFHTMKYNPLTGATMWAHVNDGSGGGNAGPTDMCVDAVGNVYVTGTGGATSHGDEYFTMKYNTSGALIWENAYTNSRSGERAAAIAVDGQGNVFVTGHSFSDAGVSSIGTIKYDAAGNKKWVRHYNGDDDAGGAHGTDIAVDAAGNVYVTGYASYMGTHQDLVILKYDNNGTQLSSNRYDGQGNDEAISMVLDASANIYITGKSDVLNHGIDCLTLKYNSNCNIIWERLFNGIGSKADVPSEIAVDAAGNVFVAGSTTVNLSGSTDRDFLLIKYDPNGNKLWDVNYGGAQNIIDAATGLALDGSDNIYVTGHSGDLGSKTALVDYVTIKYNTAGVQQWLQVYDGPDGFSDDPEDILADANGNIYVSGSSFRTSTQYDIATVKYTQCNITCPLNISVNNDAGQCGAVVNFNPATYTGDCGSTFTYSHNTGTEFPVGKTTVTVTSDETGATCSFDITVNDNENPVITSCPGSKTVNTDANSCYATVNVGVATATDNCSATVTGSRSDGKELTDTYLPGTTTITWTATDPSNNTASCIQTITVMDNQAPVISNASVSKTVLTPPNHKMVDVEVLYSVTDNCSFTYDIAVTSNEPQTGLSNGDVGPDWIIVDKHHVQLRAERDGKGDGRVYTITITANDGQNITTKPLTVVVAHDIKSPVSGAAVKVGSTVNFAGTFWDVAGNKHTAKWLIDDKTLVGGSVTEPSGMKNGTITGSYKFTSPGVYKLQMNITDQKGFTTYTNTNGDLEAIVVVYDPNGGYTYGGGYFASPVGALKANPIMAGDVSYGFTVNYYKGATFPKGETQFDFKLGDFEFNALNFDYLAINNSTAQFRGTGKIIGGQSGIGFTMTVVDGQLDGTGVDKIRLKIYNKNTGQIYYDNQPGASDAALPTQAVGANSTIVISGTNAIITSANRTQQAEEAKTDETINDFNVIAFPNPSTSNFTINVKGNANEKITLQVVDMYGRIIETKNVTANSITRFGDRYRPGTYFVRIIQGKEHKEIKLVKLD